MKCATCHGKVSDGEFCSTPCRKRHWYLNNQDRIKKYRQTERSKPDYLDKAAKKRQANPTYLSNLFWRRKHEWAMYLGQCRCSTCGESRLPCLEFHHKDPGSKTGDVTLMIRHPKKYNTEQLKAEVDKCILLCANCHRIQTSKHWSDFVLHA